MRKIHLLFALPLMVALITTPLQAQKYAGETDISEVTVSAVPETVVREHALPENDFWDRLATCETNKNWQDGGTWAGGLGIFTKSSFPKSAMGTWERFGGEEFASSPNKATREQQIEIANRIAVKGWSKVVKRPAEYARRHGVPQIWLYERTPVGLNGWGCYKSKSTGKYRMSPPKMYYHEDPSLVPHMVFHNGQEGPAVHDLQVFLGGLKVDGVYGKKTKQAHKEYIKKNGAANKSTVSAQSLGRTKKVDKSCPQWEKMLREYGLPVADFSRIMYRESRCQPNAIGWNYYKGTSYKDCKLSPAATYKKCKAVRSYDSGLLQINSSWKTITATVCKSKFGDLTVLLNAECNLKVASYLFEEGGGISNWKATSGRG